MRRAIVEHTTKLPPGIGMYFHLILTESDIWVQYGNMLKDSGRFEDAETAYLEAISRDPTIADTYLQYGHLLKRSGRLEEAANSYRKAVMYDRSSQNSARPELQRLIEQGVTTAKITVAFDVSDFTSIFAITVYRPAFNESRWRQYRLH